MTTVCIDFTNISNVRNRTALFTIIVLQGSKWIEDEIHLVIIIEMVQNMFEFRNATTLVMFLIGVIGIGTLFYYAAIS